MNEIEDIRWQQRFENYEKAFLLLKKASLIECPSEVERAGMIQFFEMTFELSWKLLKDYLEEEGYDINSPREAIKQGIQSKIIQNGDWWMSALQDRNLTVHTYHEEIAVEVETEILNTYLLMLEELYNHFKTMMESR